MLLLLARGAIAEHFGQTPRERLHAAWLTQPGATFVTLTLHGKLRGCIGSLEARLPLIEDVRHNAVAAAFQDPRFTPLSDTEFSDVSIEISLLSKPDAILFTNEADAISQLVPGRDGVILESGNHRATFLPQVWLQLTKPQAFLAHLKNKAGLPENHWTDEIKLSRYNVTKWSEEEH